MIILLTAQERKFIKLEKDMKYFLIKRGLKLGIGSAHKCGLKWL